MRGERVRGRRSEEPSPPLKESVTRLTDGWGRGGNWLTLLLSDAVRGISDAVLQGATRGQCCVNVSSAVSNTHSQTHTHTH